MPTATPELPPVGELFEIAGLVARHPALLSRHRIQWALRHRRSNGLAAAGAVYESTVGVLLIHEPAFLRWFLGLAGRRKPRALRKRTA